MASWFCARCGAPDGRNRRSACCTPCRAEMDAQGLVWCTGCESEQPLPPTWTKKRGRCQECENARARNGKPRRAPRIALPSAKPADISAQIVMAWAVLADPEFPSSFDLAA